MKVIIIFGLLSNLALADERSTFMKSCMGTLKFDPKLSNAERSKILNKSLSDCNKMYDKKTNPNIQLAEKKLEIGTLKQKMKESKKVKKKIKKIK